MKTVIIGGGASGIACAVSIKMNMPSAEVTVIEHLDSPCKKLYATGNGRCNITNKNAEGYENTKDFFESLGLVLRESGEGRVYPYSNQAATVVNILLGACEKYGVKIVCNCNAYKVESIGGQYNVFTDKGVFSCDVLVLATGGQAQKALGSDGSGYALSKMLGHSVTELSPALVQLVSSSKNCRALKGVRTKCNVTVETNKKPVETAYGELLFTDYGISGIVTMDLSHHVNDARLKSGKDRTVAVIDFVPSKSAEELEEHINKFGSLEGILPAKLCSILERQSGGNAEKAASYAKNWRLIITGTKGYSFAQITSGGVPVSELNDSCESEIHENLYIIGELTDRQFKCGGYNLNFAFLSAVKAAESIVSKKYSYDKN